MRCRLLAGCALLLLASLDAECQTLRADSQLVLVPTIVTGSDYHLIRGLRKENFRLRVDRSSTPVEALWREQAPFSAVIVFDASGSMKPLVARATQVIDAVLSLAHADDEYALIVCRNRPEVATPLTGDLSRLRAALPTSAEGATPLYDSLELAMQLVRQGRHERKMILVISDGEDTGSRVPYEHVRSSVLETRAYLYAIQLAALWTPDSPGYYNLRELAERTGGVWAENVSQKKAAELLARLDLHENYVLAFRPPSPGALSKPHRIAVHVEDVGEPSPRLFWRRSYQDCFRGCVK